MWTTLSSHVIHNLSIKGNVTALFYKNLLEKVFFSTFEKNKIIKEYWFIQDGAALYRTQDVFEAIFYCFNTRVMSVDYLRFVNGELQWPPYKPNLNPLGFFFLSYLKNKIYKKNNPKTLSELKNEIVFKIDNIEVDISPCEV